MKYKDLFEYFTEQSEQQSDDVNSYDMKYVNGGFSNSVDIQPGVDEDIGTVKVSINIFGGGQKKKVVMHTPPKIAKILKAYDTAVRKNDPSADTLKKQLETYYSEMRNAIASNFLPLIQELDAKTKSMLLKTVDEVNGKFQ